MFRWTFFNTSLTKVTGILILINMHLVETVTARTKRKGNPSFVDSTTKETKLESDKDSLSRAILYHRGPIVEDKAAIRYSHVVSQLIARCLPVAFR